MNGESLDKLINNLNANHLNDLLSSIRVMFRIRDTDSLRSMVVRSMQEATYLKQDLERLLDYLKNQET